MDAIRPAKPALLLIMKCIYFQNLKWILNWIDQEWGGVPEYLRQIGVQSETIQKIKSKFVENLYM